MAMITITGAQAHFRKLLEKQTEENTNICIMNPGTPMRNVASLLSGPMRDQKILRLPLSGFDAIIDPNSAPFWSMLHRFHQTRWVLS